MNPRPLLAALAAALAAGGALAQSASAEGVVRKVDAANGRVIVQHGPFRGHDMSAMTMAFDVRDPALLAGLKPQDAIRFAAEKHGRGWTITSIDATPQPALAVGKAR